MTVVLAVAAAGCGTGDGGPGSTSERVQSSAASGVGEEDWAALGLPYGELDREADPPVWRLAYRDHMVEVPFATDNGESTPITQLLSMTATKNAAVFELAPPEGAPRLWMLTAQGEWSQIAEDVHGIPLANVNGTEVYWNVAVEGKDETALVGFDTADGSKFLDVTVADQPYVSAMDAGVAFLSPTSLEQPARMVDAAGEDVLSSSRAGVNVDELVTAYREGVGAMVRSGEAVSRLALPDGSTAFELDGDFYGQFNSVGTYVALSDPCTTGSYPFPQARRWR